MAMKEHIDCVVGEGGILLGYSDFHDCLISKTGFSWETSSKNCSVTKIKKNGIHLSNRNVKSCQPYYYYIP